MKRRITWLTLAALLCALLASGALAGEDAPVFGCRFATAEEGAALLLAKRAYHENMNQIDLDYRLQKTGATLAELEAFIPEQMRDFTDDEKALIETTMAEIGAICAERGYRLPATDGIVFVKTTMAEECYATAYTHGAEIYIGESILQAVLAGEPGRLMSFKTMVAHELFHCLTRNNPDFRAGMYAILGFTVEAEDYEFAPAIRDAIISNPDVGHHDAHAAFDIRGERRECVVVFTAEPFRKPGDTFFASMTVGLVPIDDLGVMFRTEEADNFREVFGRNTNYVIDPEETLADNFKYTIFLGPDGAEYPTPEIILAMDAFLKNFGAEE